MAAEMGETIRGIEGEAEKLLEKAGADAQNILKDAEKKIAGILSAETVMDEVRTEYDRVISEAKEEAGKKLQASKKKADVIRSRSSRKIDTLSQQTANRIRGIL